jgi:hypothetical protein
MDSRSLPYELDQRPLRSIHHGGGGGVAALEGPGVTAVIWIASAAASGVIGNALYDALKAQVKAIRSRWLLKRRSRKPRHGRERKPPSLRPDDTSQLVRIAEAALFMLIDIEGGQRERWLPQREPTVYWSRNGTWCVERYFTEHRSVTDREHVIWWRVKVELDIFGKPTEGSVPIRIFRSA